MEKAFVLICEDPIQINGSSERLYAGIDRAPWSCVDAVRYSGKLPEELEASRKRSFEQQIGNLSFGSLSSFEEVAALASACTSHCSLSITEVELLGRLDQPDTLLNGVSACEGIDAYVDGYGSIIRLGLVEKPAHFAAVLDTINTNGLFHSVEAARLYMSHYRSVAMTGTLEVLDLESTVWLYGICNYKYPSVALSASAG